MSLMIEYATAQGALLLATAIWSLVGAVLIWLAIWVVNRFLKHPIVRPAYWKAFTVVFVPGVVIQLLIAILLAVDLRFAGMTNYLVFPIAFFGLCAMLIVLLPTTALQACFVSGVYLLITVAAGGLFALAAESLRFLA